MYFLVNMFFLGQHFQIWLTLCNLANVVIFYGLVLYGLDGFECTIVCREGQEPQRQLKKTKIVPFWTASAFWERNTIFIYPGLCLFFGETCSFETPFVQCAARWSNLVWFPSTQYLTTTPFLGGFCLRLT